MNRWIALIEVVSDALFLRIHAIRPFPPSPYLM